MEFTNAFYLCDVKREDVIKCFVQLGRVFDELAKENKWSGFDLGVTEMEYEKLQTLIDRQFVLNGWFTKDNVLKSLAAWAQLLQQDELTEWSSPYSFSEQPKTIALIMAGNLPLVGFHDFLTVVLSGNKALCKLSSEDQTLLPAFIELLIKWNPELQDKCKISAGKLTDFDAVIATGTNNSMQHFKQYFEKYPHIFRNNRTSIAVISGTETKDDFEKLGEDIFAYFGLGCRNVTHLLLPKDFEISRFFEGIFGFSDVIYHKKYGNNYDYNKAVYLMNQLSLFDNNFVLLRESTDLFSPIALIHYHYYENPDEIGGYIAENEAGIQVVVGKEYQAFGTAQCPRLTDYADNVNTFAWLEGL